MSKPIDLSKILAKYKNGWIALSPDNKKLIATGKTLKEVLNESGKKGVSNPTVFKSATVKNLFAG